MANKNKAHMENSKKTKVVKPEVVTIPKSLTSNKEALPKALQSFSKAFAEYYKGFIL